MPRSWLLVYLADPSKPGGRWLDRGNDPELRAWPMTWGICRTDVRMHSDVGDDLFFIACGADRPLADRYCLAAKFRVAEKISWPEAVERCAGRRNVILEPLPRGASLGDRVLAYVAHHQHELRWTGKRRVLASLRECGEWLRQNADMFVTTLAGREYIHAYYDDHDNWRSRRLDGPYVVADTAASTILAEPIPYVELVAECHDLPAVDKLRTSGPQPRHNKRLLSPAAAAYLSERVRNSAPYVIAGSA